MIKAISKIKKKRQTNPSNKFTAKIEFDNEKAARHFLYWLCESGEQSYWLWQECREQAEDGDITAIDFDYHHGKGFAEDLKVIAKCGRLDKR